MGGPGTGSKIGLHCGTSANATRPRFAKTFFFFFFATGPQQNFDNKMFAKRNQKKKGCHGVHGPGVGGGVCRGSTDCGTYLKIEREREKELLPSFGFVW